MDPGTLFLKVWNGKGERKAVLAKTYKDLVEKGVMKLGLTQTPLIYLEDGTEISEDVYGGLSNNTVLYFLMEDDHKPWNQSTCQTKKSCGDSEAGSSTQTEVSSPSEIILSPNSLHIWPEVFIIPEHRFSFKLKEDIAKGSLCWMSKSELLGILSEEIQQYTLKPNFIQRDIVARALVLQFPTLKSNIGEGHEGWRLKIYDRIREDLRKKGANCLRVKKRQPVKDSTILEMPNKKFCRNFGVEYIINEASSVKKIADAIDEMKTEMLLLRTKRNEKLLEDNLKITYDDRRRLINENILMKDFKNIYPALFTVSGINQDFKILKNVSLQTAFIVSIKCCSESIYKICEKKFKGMHNFSNTKEKTHFSNTKEKTHFSNTKEKTHFSNTKEKTHFSNTKEKTHFSYTKEKTQDTFLIKMIEKFHKVSNLHINYSLVFTASVIPTLLGEKSEIVFQEFPTESLKEDLCSSPITPHLAVVGEIFSSNEVYIVAEQQILIECCDFLEALATLIGLYFVCNIKYPHEAEKTFIFFETYCLKLSSEKIPSKVNSLCNKLPAVVFQ